MKVCLRPRTGCRWGKAERILKRKHFKKVQTSGRRFSGKFLILVLGKGQAPWARFGLTVGKGVGNAVVRNRTKRRLRDILRNHKNDLQNGDFVVIAKTQASKAKYADLAMDLQTLLGRIKR